MPLHANCTIRVLRCQVLYFKFRFEELNMLKLHRLRNDFDHWKIFKEAMQTKHNWFKWFI